MEWSTFYEYNSRVSCQKGPTCHAYEWQLGPFWQDTLKILFTHEVIKIIFSQVSFSSAMSIQPYNRNTTQCLLYISPQIPPSK